MNRYESWGRYRTFQDFEHDIRTLNWRNANLRLDQFDQPVLPFGLGRSYGDSCLNDNGILLDITPLNRFIAFDPETGVLRAEGGVTLAQILDLITLRGWFLTVTPGTKYVTVGGAIANDVHGKNHAYAGTFGAHVLKMEILRANGERIICSPDENPGLFRATIGGIGLTGVILWADMQLKRIKSPFINQETIKFRNLDEFFAIAEASEADYEYTVAWIDGMGRGNAFGRGLFIRGNNATPPFNRTMGLPSGRKLTVPIDAPGFALNRLSMSAFNTLYYHRVPGRIQKKLVHYEPFFYPLDMISRWNRIYGKRGFMQYQFVLPFHSGYRAAIETIIHKMVYSDTLPFLNVFKTFGDYPSPGMLSFPRRGVTLAIDFPNLGQKTLDFLEEMDTIVKDNGGIGYPAKDTRMSGESFRTFYPEWETFSTHIDPQFSSSFWRRVTDV